MGDKFHTCSLRSIFRQVQKVNCSEGAREATLGCAPAENFLTFFAASGGKLWEAFDKPKRLPRNSAAALFGFLEGKISL